MPKIPDFLSDYATDIESTALECARIKATKMATGERTGLQQSKFRGLPYLPVGIDYPRDAAGKPLMLIAQVNFAEVPPLDGHPSSGILQLFLSDEWWRMAGARILFHPDVSLPAQTEFDFLTDAIYAGSPIDAEYKLEFTKDDDYGGLNDFRCALDFDGEDYHSIQDQFSEEEQSEMEDLFRGTGHKMGGYSYFTQDDPRSLDSDNEYHVSVLQIDSQDGIEWGDAGVAHVFVDEDALAAGDFSQAYFYYDCC